MNLTKEINDFLQSIQHNANDIYAIVGVFPHIKIKDRELPEGNIVLKNGYQDRKNIHSGYGLAHIIKGSHTHDAMYREVESLADLVKVIKNALKKHSKIYMEHFGNTIVISNMNTQKIVLDYREEEGVYSVITCHSITKNYDAIKKHGDSIGKIKKDLTNT